MCSQSPVDHTEWAQWGSLSLRVYPSCKAVQASRRLGMTAADAAWAEVLAQYRRPDTAWHTSATGSTPNQTTRQTQLNLEPWRLPSTTEMLASGCNPGTLKLSF